MVISWNILIGGTISLLSYLLIVQTIIWQVNKRCLNDNIEDKHKVINILNSFRNVGMIVIIIGIATAMLWTGWRFEQPTPKRGVIEPGVLNAPSFVSDNDRDNIIRKEGKNLQDQSYSDLQEFRKEMLKNGNKK